MFEFPIEKYTFIQNGNKIFALSSYEGKTVRAVAKCHPDDEFSVENGKKLAAARCNAKIAKRRFRRATKLNKEAAEKLAIAQRWMYKMDHYLNDSEDALGNAEYLVKEYENGNFDA
jgi:hypothetical protein